MIRSATKPIGINLDARSNQPLKAKSSLLCENTGSILQPQNIGYIILLNVRRLNNYSINRTHFLLGKDDRINFKKDDVNEIKKFDEPSLKLMGFKPKERVKAYHNIRSSYFLYPDDDVI